MKHLVPILFVFIFGLFTHRVLIALSVGILLEAMLLATSPEHWVELLIHQVQENLVFEKLVVFAFIAMAGFFFDFLLAAEGTQGLMKYLQKKIRSKRQAEVSMTLISHLLLFDGIFSCMMMTSLMYPLNKKFKIPSLRIALFANALAAPMTVLVPFSGFAAVLIGSLHSRSEIFSSSLPYFFYPLILLVQIWVVVLWQHPLNLVEEFSPALNISLEENEEGEGRLWHFFFPLGLLSFFLCLFLFVIPLDLAKNLLVSTSLTTIITMGIFLQQKMLQWRKLPSLFLQSMKNSFLIILIIFLAWIMADFLVADWKSLHFSPFDLPRPWMPLIFFVMSSLVAMALGTLWGAVVLLIPILLALYPSEFSFNNSQFLYLLVGASVSGATIGDHLSLISDTTILTALRTQSSIAKLFRLQLRFVFPVFVGSCVAFIAAGWGIPSYWSFMLGILSSIALLFIAKGLKSES